MRVRVYKINKNKKNSFTMNNNNNKNDYTKYDLYEWIYNYKAFVREF